MEIELGYKNSVKCYLKWLIYNMLLLLLSAVVVWCMLILEILAMNLIGINGCLNSQSIKKNMHNLSPIWTISTPDISLSWWPEFSMALMEIKHLNHLNSLFQEPTLMLLFNWLKFLTLLSTSKTYLMLINWKIFSFLLLSGL